MPESMWLSNPRSTRHVWEQAREYRRPVLLTIHVKFPGTLRNYEYLFMVDTASSISAEWLLERLEDRIGKDRRELEWVTIHDVWRLTSYAATGDRLLRSVSKLVHDSKQPPPPNEIVVDGEVYVRRGHYGHAHAPVGSRGSDY